ncbi:Alpha/Beta hydrolase protein, partial [Thamnocephalis sphaerospora]
SGLFLVYRYQCSIIYLARFPEGSRQEVDKPSKYQLPFEEVWLRTKDGVRLHAYLITRDSDTETSQATTLFYCHANAGNMGHRLPIAETIYRQCGCNVFMLSYRGYGLSEGQANEAGIRIDTQTALDFIRQHPLVKDTRIVMFGQSIGGAVAIDLAARNEDQIHAIMLENTFLNLPAIIPHVMPFLASVTFLCHQHWPSDELIGKLRRMPILFLASERDELVPPSHMTQLYDLTNTNAPVVWRSFPEGTHNDACLQPGYFEAIAGFWRDHIV